MVNPAKPAANLPKRPGRRRYVSPNTERMLRDLFPGMVPATVIEDAVRQFAIKLGKLDPNTRKKITP